MITSHLRSLGQSAYNDHQRNNESWSAGRMGMTSSPREQILGRVRQALKTPSPEPHWLHESVSDGPIFPLPGPTVEALKARFHAEFTAIQGEWFEADSFGAAQAVLGEWMAKCNIRSLLAPDQSALRKLLPPDSDTLWITSQSAGREDWDKRDAGITLCESLIAESGSICVSAARTGRLPSVLPPAHLVIADESQLVPDIETSMERLKAAYPESLPSTMSWISGPSRTADIEKILVLGAHGPRRLFLLMLPAGMIEALEKN